MSATAVVTAPAVAGARTPHSPGRPRVLLLGPQRNRPTISAALRRHDVQGPVAVVTAGWQEREQEVEELEVHLARRTIPLDLYRRVDEILSADEDLARKHRARQDELRRLQRYYDVRLGYAMSAVAELEQRAGDEPELEHHRWHAMDTVITLDAEHLAEVLDVHRRHAPLLDLENRREVIRHRREVADLLRDAEALAIAGGHVAVLMNRLRILDPLESFPEDRTVLGWSAGAIALTERIVLYHDHPPQGFGNAEVLEPGLGLAHHVVALPHPHRRLALDDAARVSRLARRLAPARCFALEDGAILSLSPSSYTAGEGVLILETDGEVGPAS